MAFTRTDSGIVEISVNGNNLRVEAGPRRVVAKATKELLSDEVTAEHYQAPRSATPEEIASEAILTIGNKVHRLDADGKPIVLGEDMAYLDWLGVQRGTEGSKVFYLYVDRDRVGPELEDTTETRIWGEVGIFETEEAAIGAALEYGV